MRKCCGVAPKEYPYRSEKGTITACPICQDVKRLKGHEP